LAGARREKLSVTERQIRDVLSHILSPDGIPLTQAKVLSEIAINDGKAYFSINVDAANAPAWSEVRAKAEAAVRGMAGVTSAMVVLTAEKKPTAAAAPAPYRRVSGTGGGVPPASAHRPAPHAAAGSPMAKQAPIPGIAAIVAVASGKGGVGKSTTALNLALGLRDLGLRVGLMDADIYGPSVPRLTAIHDKPVVNEHKKMIPIERFGLSIMSIGFLVEEETAMIWRGPMVMSAITQMLREVAWGKLDILVVDMPPGTGDAQLTLAQNVPLKGAVIVSTPQDLALIDARRAIDLFAKMDVPVLGLVENMAGYACPHCGKISDPFGRGGAEAEAAEMGVPFLGRIPLTLSIRQASDAGTPPAAGEGEEADIFAHVAAAVLDEVNRKRPTNIM
jgi:ATP-binding protein involved in chromosome partitioning